MFRAAPEQATRATADRLAGVVAAELGGGSGRRGPGNPEGVPRSIEPQEGPPVDTGSPVDDRHGSAEAG
jgi:hypothetical protein